MLDSWRSFGSCDCFVCSRLSRWCLSYAWWSKVSLLAWRPWGGRHWPWLDSVFAWGFSLNSPTLWGGTQTPQKYIGKTTWNFPFFSQNLRRRFGGCQRALRPPYEGHDLGIPAAHCCHLHVRNLLRSGGWSFRCWLPWVLERCRICVRGGLVELQ